MGACSACICFCRVTMENFAGQKSNLSQGHVGSWWQGNSRAAGPQNQGK